MIKIEDIADLTNGERKLIAGLSTQKERREHGLFLTERTKNVFELIDSTLELHLLVATHAWFESHRDIDIPEYKCRKAKAKDMERMTTLSSAPDVVATFLIPVTGEPPFPSEKELFLAVDGVQDPGNMGTILRLADWFGIPLLLCGSGCVDVYNPKCVIASMGSISRVTAAQVDLPAYLASARDKGTTIWGTFLDGESIYELSDKTLPYGILVMGSEGKGISDEVAELVTRRISIPEFPQGKRGAESLNVAIAAAITVAEFRRRISKI